LNLGFAAEKSPYRRVAPSPCRGSPRLGQGDIVFGQFAVDGCPKIAGHRHPIFEYIPDLIANDAIIIEPKVISKISDHERGRMINYLRITGSPVGLILNFRRARLEWEQVILTDSKPPMDSPSPGPHSYP
jgi:hypothetical protein